MLNKNNGLRGRTQSLGVTMQVTFLANFTTDNINNIPNVIIQIESEDGVESGFTPNL